MGRVKRAVRSRLQFRRADSRPQLVMWYVQPSLPPLADLGAGYVVRPYQPGDEPGWVALLNANGRLGGWSLERAQHHLSGTLLKAAQCFVLHGSQIVASAGVYASHADGKDSWELGWVATHPSHRGKRLGYQVSAAAMRAASEVAPRPIYLRSHDARRPALKLYLKMGFVPDYAGDPSYPDRWRRVFSKLGAAYQVYRAGGECRMNRPHQAERSFGISVGVAFLFFGGLLWWRGHAAGAPVLAGLGAGLVLGGLACPALLVRPRVAWERVAHVLGWINMRVILCAAFLVVLTPVGWCMRRFGWDPLCRRPGRRSGWCPYPSRYADAKHFDLMY